MASCDLTVHTIYVEFLRDVICEVFTVNWSSEKLSSLTKLGLASAGEQDTCEWLHMALVKDDGKF